MTRYHTDRQRNAQPLTAEQKALCEAFAEQYPKLTGAIRTKFPGTYRWARACGLDDDDIHQQAWIGVIQAAKKFNPDLEIKFVTYALHAARNQVQRPCNDAGRAKRTPQPGAVVVSGSQRVGREGGKQTTRFDLTPDRTPNPESAIIEREARAERKLASDTLLMSIEPRLRTILYRRFVHGDTLDVVSERVGVTRERVRQLQENAVRQLRMKAGLGVVCV